MGEGLEAKGRSIVNRSKSWTGSKREKGLMMVSVICVVVEDEFCCLFWGLEVVVGGMVVKELLVVGLAGPRDDELGLKVLGDDEVSCCGDKGWNTSSSSLSTDVPSPFL